MSEPYPRRHDPTVLRAIAHPTRNRILNELEASGPLRAADIARLIDIPANQASFHLRQLAKYGFVEEAAAGQDRRERVWQLTDVEQSWRSGPATDQLDRVFAQREADRVLGWTARRAAEPAHWQDAAFLGGASLPVTADELLEIRQQLWSVLEPYVARVTDGAPRPEGARFVRLLLAGTPIGEADAED